MPRRPDPPRSNEAPASTANPPPSLRSRSIPTRPDKLGRYDVVGKIAAGGMASIYLGRSREPREPVDGQDVVALKVMRHEASDDPNMVNMFLDEANLLVRLRHPNIVRTFESGVDGGHEFIAMELLVGRTLANVYDACISTNVRIDPDVVAWICAGIARALDYAHELRDDAGPLGIIHRDVNPSNVFLTFDGHVKLFDFGMAKFASRHAKSAPGVVKGKLPYLAPEQIMQLPLDRRADVFGLGTTLWELLTMRRLFQRETDIETVKAVHVGPIPDVRSIVPELPARIAAIAQRALERNREHRFASTADFARELEAVATAGGSTPSDIEKRVSAMLDTLFPTERKRQMGWLKPAISGSGPMSRPPGSR